MTAPAAACQEDRRRHPLHDDANTWPEVNCYVDVWVELLHSRGYDPLLACGFVFESDCDGTQWTFHKYDLEDLLLVYGIKVAEINVWRDLASHVREHLAAGRLLTVEVDAYCLPDTYGVSYQRQHVKTTIAVEEFDAEALSLRYFHNGGRHEAQGDDVVRLLRLEGGFELAPYVETVTFDAAPVAPAAVLDRARVHVRRRASGDPVGRLREQLHADLARLVAETARDEQVCYDYAFNTVRQCGAGAQLAARYVETLGALDGSDMSSTAAALDRVASSAKSLQFVLTRLAHGRRGDLDGPLDAMSADWAAAMAVVTATYG